VYFPNLVGLFNHQSTGCLLCSPKRWYSLISLQVFVTFFPNFGIHPPVYRVFIFSLFLICALFDKAACSTGMLHKMVNCELGRIWKETAGVLSSAAMKELNNTTRKSG
jgi:hypothetical protein